MKIHRLFVINIILLFFGFYSFGQIDEDQTGAWYMLFWTHDFKESPFGVQGDYQYRNWNMGGDLEQFMFRNGVTFRPSSGDIKFTLGYAHIKTGAFGESTSSFGENRIYQEALMPQKIGGRFFITHRFRYEQRFVEGQDMRTRYRYFIGVNVPVNRQDLKQGAVYIAFYNELFINGEREIGDGRTVQIFDRNRVYSGAGYSLKDRSRVQLAIMRQSTDLWTKNQLQVSWHQTF